LSFYKTAQRFESKVPIQDREDIRHDIIIELAKAKARDGDKPFTEAMMYRIASFVVADYWRKEKRKPTILSLESDLTIDDSNTAELMEVVADDTAIDLDAWVDARTFLLGCPIRLIQIANKMSKGDNLSATDSQYLWRFRKHEQKRIMAM
jgi:DNA-directed RNA polymerase specialized sigma24 family protein